ncbi:MAG: hypothetical protein QNJ57_02815 [Flavobacteriaceae bacterium]|nr:hypothetical protein [Flavobacteriaceae bacterium]
MILFSKLLIPKNYNGLAIYPFIFLKNKALSNNDVLINHERIHLRQQAELLIVFFFIWYILEFLFHLIRTFSWNRAYRSISFEKEAYKNEGNPNYLLDRKFWSFLKYFNQK